MICIALFLSALSTMLPEFNYYWKNISEAIINLVNILGIVGTIGIVILLVDWYKKFSAESGGYD